MRVSKFSLLLLLFSLFSLLQTLILADKKPYVVYLGSHSHGQNPTPDDIDRARIYHHEFLGSVLGSDEEAKDSIIHSYGRHINGFSAVLEEKHAEELAKHPQVVSVFEDENIKLHTTNAWDFLGLEKNKTIPPDSVWKKARFGEGVIIANLDTGVWPESKSFNEEGLGPVPSKWKGICQSDDNKEVTCNKKLIGARYINLGLIQTLQKQNSSFVAPQNLSTPRDFSGHGTHTLSTAAGNFVPNVGVFGHGHGQAKGGSPRARVASYKVCWKPNGKEICNSADVLAAFDIAIQDGVDVISVSMGSKDTDYFSSSVAIGAFHAMMSNVSVIASAGNDGPVPKSVTNVAPWIFTVGASTTDRRFSSYVILGNKMFIKGSSMAKKGQGANNLFPLITGLSAKVAKASNEDAKQCNNGTIDPKKIKGKILVCYGTRNGHEKGQTAAKAGAKGMILVNDKKAGQKIVLSPNVLPDSLLNYIDGESVFAYVNSTKDPVASISPTVTEYNTRPSQMTALFSSRGPNPVDPAILKPDVTAPGVDIIAANTEDPEAHSNLHIPYTVLSGSSIASPVVAGIVGLIKTLNPDWTPAAIRSAIMTTATTTDKSNRLILDQSTGEIANPFANGAGHVDVKRATDPGLVYELGVQDYLAYICKRGYKESAIDTFTAPEKFTCPKSFRIEDFNYPSITIPKLNKPITITRKVKNVGPASSSYKAIVNEMEGVTVTVEPTNLRFTKKGEEKKFKVTFTPRGNVKPKDYVFGELIWSDGSRNVRSPIAVML